MAIPGGVIIDRVDCRGLDELFDRHYRRALDLDAIKIVVAQEKVFALAEFVTFDERAALQFIPGLAILRDHADAVAGVRIDQMESEPGAVVARVQSYRRVQSWLDGLGSTPCGGPSALPDVSATAR